MPVINELQTRQLLQGLQRENPRLFDLINSLINGVVTLDKQLNPVPTLPPTTTINVNNIENTGPTIIEVDNDDDAYFLANQASSIGL